MRFIDAQLHNAGTVYKTERGWFFLRRSGVWYRVPGLIVEGAVGRKYELERALDSWEMRKKYPDLDIGGEYENAAIK